MMHLTLRVRLLTLQAANSVIAAAHAHIHKSGGGQYTLDTVGSKQAKHSERPTWLKPITDEHDSRQIYRVDMNEYLQTSEMIDWHHPDIVALARAIAAEHHTVEAVARACFEWVRDQIYHSVDYQMNPVTCRASDVLHHKTGYCYAKSHLLAALLRANQIPAGFCYQRLSINDQGAPFCLHGLNAVYLADYGWYRIDARGNKDGINAQFTPPIEQLAFRLQCSEEADFTTVYPDPLPMVIAALRSQTTWDAMLQHLPDVEEEPPCPLGNRTEITVTMPLIR